MVINCSKARWKIKDLIDGLDSDYLYRNDERYLLFK